MTSQWSLWRVRLAGRALRKEAAIERYHEELEELGLLGVELGFPTKCPFQVRRKCPTCEEAGPNACGRGTDCGLEDCGRPVIKDRFRCIGHRKDDPTATLRGAVKLADAMGELREYLSFDLVPLGLSALHDALSDEEAGHEIKVRAAFGVMDRGGLPAGAKLEVEQVIKVDSPIDLLRASLEGARDRLAAAGTVIDAEVISDDHG